MNELEQTREEIANLRLPVNNQPNHKYRYLNYELADRILSIKGIRIECENQELPYNQHSGGTQISAGYTQAQQDMLKEDWVKCERKEK